MKYLVTMTAQTPLATIPWNTGAAYTGWIYRLLERSNPALGRRIHQQAPIKPFAVTPLQFEEGVADSRGYTPYTPFATMTLGTLDLEIAEAFVRAATLVPLDLGPMRFQALSLIECPEPRWALLETQVLDCYPIALRQWATIEGHRHAQPKFPRDPDWNTALAQNLAHKMRVLQGVDMDPDAIAIEAGDEWQARYQILYGHPIPAFQPRNGLRLTAPPAVYTFLFALGFGILNSAGLGGLRMETLNRWVDWDAVAV